MEISSLQLFDAPALLAAGGIAADKLPGLGWLTNSIFVAAIVTGSVLLFTRMATKRMALIPGGKQNFVEFVVEFLYGQVEEIVGKDVALRVFPLLATLFIFILISNWFGLVPGVGTVGFGDTSGPLTIAPDAEKFTPLLRPATADLNMTLGMAVVFMMVWVWVTVREIGVIGFIKHTFAPKGGLTGALWWVLLPIFIFVGLIEIISIMFRPVSLSFRLFGNIYAGETLLATMAKLGESLGFPEWAQFVSSIVFPLPFYFMELLIGMLQAIVFALLCAVYVQLSTAHDEEEH